jgi:hypothetical protein
MASTPDYASAMGMAAGDRCRIGAYMTRRLRGLVSTASLAAAVVPGGFGRARPRPRHGWFACLALQRGACCWSRTTGGDEARSLRLWRPVIGYRRSARSGPGRAGAAQALSRASRCAGALPGSSTWQVGEPLGFRVDQRRCGVRSLTRPSPSDATGTRPRRPGGAGVPDMEAPSEGWQFSRVRPIPFCRPAPA